MRKEHTSVFVGQVLYRELYNRNAPNSIREYTVNKIGKKYFYLDELGDRNPIDKNTLKYTSKEYSQNNFQLYKTSHEILDKNEKHMLADKLRKHFDWLSKSENTIEQLRSACQILGINKTDEKND